MDVFYIEIENNIEKGEILTLDSSESHHAVRVLRKKEGDVLGIMNGRGITGKAVVRAADKKQCALEISDLSFNKKTLPQLHLFIGLPKSNDRTEWLLEKSTELGVQEITPLSLEHSERKKIKFERAEKVLLAACKQSQNPFLPKLHAYKTLEEVFEVLKGESYFGHCEAGQLKSHMSSIKIKSPLINLFIGPEGDFSSNEIELLKKHDIHPVHLDALRLRTETAAINGISQLKLLFEINQG